MYRINGIFGFRVPLVFVEQGPEYNRKQCFFVDVVRLSQIGFVASGAPQQG
jgi:hypothetical protein